MAATAGVATPFTVYKVLGSGTAVAHMKRLPEKLTQTFLQGTPVQVDAGTGFVQANPTINSAATALIAGFSTEPANNLTASGTAKTLTQTGNPPNQSSAVFIPVGAWPNDGTMGFYLVDDFMIFRGLLGHSATDANATIAQTDVGSIFGLTKDATTGFWYVDKNITTIAGGACVVITDLIDAVATLHGNVAFKVLHAAQQLLQ